MIPWEELEPLRLGSLKFDPAWLPQLGRGLLTTLEITALCIALGAVLGLTLAVLRVYGRGPLYWLSSLYVQFFRGTPLLVQLFMVYYGLPSWGIVLSPFASSVLALGLNTAAYQAEYFRGAIQAIPQGQMLAARALGMSRWLAVRSIILPQALRLAIPGWSNEFSSVIKDTTLASAIGVVEVFKRASFIYQRYYELAMPAYLTVALIFLVLTYGGNWLLGRLERRLAVPGFQLRGAERARRPSEPALAPEVAR